MLIIYLFYVKLTYLNLVSFNFFIKNQFILIIKDDAEDELNSVGISALQAVGSAYISAIYYRGAWAIICKKNYGRFSESYSEEEGSVTISSCLVGNLIYSFL